MQAIPLRALPQAISGLGGVGKTQLALEYAYRHRSDYQAVLWAQAQTREALTSSYLTIASLLGLPEKDASESALVIAAVKQRLQTSTGWLLILDNADELALARDFLPPTVGGHVLLTTRAQAMGRFAHRVEVDILPRALGALFLLRRAGLLVLDAALEQAPQQEQACAICEALGGLPLALDQAGAYIEETGCSLLEYQRLFEHRSVDLLARRGGLVEDHPLPVATTWSLSFEQVEQRNPAAADLLRVCAFLAPDAIPETIVTEGAPHLGPRLASVGADPYLLGEAIEVLRAYSLLRRDVGEEVGSLLSVHRLVQAVLQESMDEPSKKTWAKRVVLALNAAFPFVEHQTWSLCDRLVPHAKRGADLINAYGMVFSEAARLLNQTGGYLSERARYQESEPLLERVLLIQERGLGEGHPDTARSLSNLAGLYQRQGKYVQAEPLLERALLIREQQLGGKHPDTARSLSNLAGLYQRQGKYVQAEPLLERALAVGEQVYGANHPEVATGLNNLAVLYQSQGKYAEVGPLLERALLIREQELGEEHPDTVRSLSNLAVLYQYQDKYILAEPLLERALPTGCATSFTSAMIWLERTSLLRLP
jgi:tetratricopeptide (TPR) repeat protein